MRFEFVFAKTQFKKKKSNSQTIYKFKKFLGSKSSSMLQLQLFSMYMLSYVLQREQNNVKNKRDFKIKKKRKNKIQIQRSAHMLVKQLLEKRALAVAVAVASQPVAVERNK